MENGIPSLLSDSAMSSKGVEVNLCAMFEIQMKMHYLFIKAQDDTLF